MITLLISNTSSVNPSYMYIFFTDIACFINIWIKIVDIFDSIDEVHHGSAAACFLKKVYPAIRLRPVTRLLYLVPRIEMLLRVLSAYNLHSAKIRKLMLSLKYLHVVANLPITPLVQRYHRKTCNKVVPCRFLSITVRHGSSAHQVLEVPCIHILFYRSFDPP